MGAGGEVQNLRPDLVYEQQAFLAATRDPGKPTENVD
jgi:hypothetical protein